jgi:xylulokinase
MLAAGMPRPAQIRASGGGLASPVWRQILADVLGADLVTTSTTEGAAFGAAVLGAVGTGWFTSVRDAAEALVRTAPSAMAGASSSAYAAANESYRALYPALAPTFHRAGDVEGPLSR